jgi:hypothetical protein
MKRSSWADEQSGERGFTKWVTLVDDHYNINGAININTTLIKHNQIYMFEH